jgi:hypothetical protein
MVHSIFLVNYLNHSEKMIFHLSTRLEKKDLQKGNAIGSSFFKI